MPEQGTKPVNKYLPPRLKNDIAQENFDVLRPLLEEHDKNISGFLSWVDKTLEKF